jgi:hypothetical protein
LKQRHRSLQNQPVGVESKPASWGRIKTGHSECLIHICFLDERKGLFNFFISAAFGSPFPRQVPQDTALHLARWPFGQDDL